MVVVDVTVGLMLRQEQAVDNALEAKALRRPGVAIGGLTARFCGGRVVVVDITSIEVVTATVVVILVAGLIVETMVEVPILRKLLQKEVAGACNN